MTSKRRIIQPLIVEHRLIYGNKIEWRLGLSC